jgi:hypothetical protein
VFNLILAVIWLGVAAAIFALPWLNPGAAPLVIPNTRLSMGWFALCLCLYNLVRWWAMRRSAADRMSTRTRAPRQRLGEQEPGEE